MERAVTSYIKSKAIFSITGLVNSVFCFTFGSFCLCVLQ